MGLRLITANTFVLNPSLEADYALIAKHKPHVVGVQEYRRGEIPGYRSVNPQGKPHNSKGYREVQLFVRENKKILSAAKTLRSPNIPGDKFGHDRWADETTFRHEDRLVNVMNTHMNAVVQGPEGLPLVQSPRTQAYVGHMRGLRNEVRFNKQLDIDTFILMDSNYRKKHPDNDWQFSPFNFPGMEWVFNGFDGILYDPERWSLRKKKVIDSKGSDHDFLLGVFDTVGK